MDGDVRAGDPPVIQQSAPAMAAMTAPETGEVFLPLLTITHSTLPQPIRVVRNLTDVVSRGNTYTAFPFQITWPQDREDQLPQVSLAIDNVDRTIGLALRSIRGRGPNVRLEVVLASSPDTLEGGPLDVVLKERDIDAATVGGVLGVEDLLNEPFPADTFAPDKFPALYDA
jgi:hypothetical protein